MHGSPYLRTLGTRPWFGGRLMVSRAHHVFDEQGAMTDKAVEEQLRKFIEGFVSYTRSQKPIPGDVTP
jgi:chromate reductase